MHLTWSTKITWFIWLRVRVMLWFLSTIMTIGSKQSGENIDKQGECVLPEKTYAFGVNVHDSRAWHWSDFQISNQTSTCPCYLQYCPIISLNFLRQRQQRNSNSWCTSSFLDSCKMYFSLLFREELAMKIGLTEARIQVSLMLNNYL